MDEYAGVEYQLESLVRIRDRQIRRLRELYIRNSRSRELYRVTLDFYPVQIRETHFLQDKQLIPDVAANFEDVRAPRYTLQEAPIQCSSGDPVISVVQCIEFCRGKSISVGIFPTEAARPLACLACSLRGCNQSTLLYSSMS